MNQIKFFTAAMGLCALGQFTYAQTANQTDTTKTTKRVSTNIVSVGYSTPVKNGYASYNNYDFVPGDTVIFTDNFAVDKNTKSTSRWRSTGAAGVKVFAFTNATAKLHNRKGMRLKKNGSLSDSFTLEFDNYSKGSGIPYVYFYKTAAAANAASNDLGLAKIGSPHGKDGIGRIEFKNQSANVDLTSDLPQEINGANYLNKWHHIAIAYKKSEVKVYVDQFKVMTVPNMGFAPRAVGIEDFTASADKPVMIANFRIANGSGFNMTGKKFTDAKIITHGINFNVDKATIKPESMGSLNLVAGIMRDNPDLKFEIDGHTDNTGSYTHNLMLSAQRAAEVRNRLIEMGIDGSRLTTKGFGYTKPLSDNLSDEGKANNRRVEFVRVQ